MTVSKGQHKTAAEWGSINEQGRLAIPAEVTDCLSWFTPSKKRLDVLIDLSRTNLIVIRSLEGVAQSLDDQREAIVQDSENLDVGLRRIAMTQYFFQRAVLNPSARRLGLKAPVLDHLRVRPGERLFCLGFADRVEAYNEHGASEIMSKYADDIVL